MGNFSHGESYELFDVNDYKFAAMICLESIFPYISRKFVADGANFLVYVANDGWYLNPPEAQQHAKQTIFRAIETRKPILRSGNTGITWVVDSYGAVLKQLEHNKLGMLSSEDLNVYSNSSKTFFVIAGNWLSYISIFITFCLILRGFIIRFKK